MMWEYACIIIREKVIIQKYLWLYPSLLTGKIHMTRKSCKEIYAKIEVIIPFW